MTAAYGTDGAVRPDERRALFQPVMNLLSGRIAGLDAWVPVERAGRLSGAREAREIEPAIQGEPAVDEPTMLKLAASALQNLRVYFGYSARVSVRLRANKGRLANLAEEIDLVLAAKGLYPDDLRLEFPAAVIRNVTELSALVLGCLSVRGYEIAAAHIADASDITETLVRLPVDIIKLDERLVQAAAVSAESMARVDAICIRARQCGLAVAAAGISEIDQLELLAEAGCCEGQGPLIAPPLALSDIGHFMKHGRYE